MVQGGLLPTVDGLSPTLIQYGERLMAEGPRRLDFMIVCAAIRNGRLALLRGFTSAATTPSALECDRLACCIGDLPSSQERFTRWRNGLRAGRQDCCHFGVGIDLS